MSPLDLIGLAACIWGALCTLWVIIGICTPDNSRHGIDNGITDLTDDERTRT